ncbi:hypothetical protein J2T13_003614 [Paenibacillus sp. DS2015]|uniref:hypothetical protein n=1 Tax=Paenibacillus sp. DS2015 TaxID=3373917 RepID=UPI003D219AFB
MAIYVYLDQKFYKKVDEPKDVNSEEMGKVAISGSEQREDGDYNLYIVTVE